MRDDRRPETGEAMDARARVVARARSYLGPNGEPADQDPEQFFRLVAPEYVGKGLGHAKSWCGIFALSCLVLEGLWPADAPLWKDGSGFVLRAVRDGRLRVVSWPEPGDIALFGAPLWHHAIVERLETAPSGGVVWTVDGNTVSGFKNGERREGVSAKRHQIDGQTVFYSIAPLLGG